MKKLLIVVDMQNDFIDGALGTEEAVGIIDKVADKIEGFDGDILVTLDTHKDNYSETREGKKLPISHCIKGSEGWELNPDIKKVLLKKQFKTFEKPVFGSVELAEYIKDNYDDNLRIELVGLCTDICVVSNAIILKTAFPEAEISVDASCCAGVTVESHNAALLTMKMCQIDIINEVNNDV